MSKKIPAEYDASQITYKIVIINGQEVKVKVVPLGMHGETWKPDLYINDSEIIVEDEKEEINRFKKDIIEVDLDTSENMKPDLIE